MLNPFFNSGSGGIGKSSSLGMLALDWAEDQTPELQQFSFVFLILLRHVKSDTCLESIIMEQHGKLKSMGVTIGEMREICQGNNKGQIMYLFDGLDEYSTEANSHIHEIMLDPKDNNFIIISSRSGNFLYKLKRQCDAEVEILGFSTDNIKKCASLYIGN